MSASFACTRCGQAIPEEDLETGTAISVLGKSYCAGCKGQAVQDISLDELMEAHPSPPPRPPVLASPLAPPPPRTPAPKAPAEAKAASKAAPPAAPTPRVASSPRNRPETRRLRISEIRRPSKAPLLAGAAVGLLAVAVTAVLVLRDPKPPATPPTPPPDPVATPEDPKPSDPRAEKALAAYTAAEVLARRSDKNFDEVLAAIETARGPCKGTRHEAKLEQLRNEILKEKDIVEGTKTFNPLFDELKGAVATDPQFARYAELMPKFEKARELAARAAPQKIGEINALQSDYKGRYEEQAQVHYPEIQEYATAMADEKRFDAALKKIETFPPQFRQSGAWRALERLKQDIERRKAGSK